MTKRTESELTLFNVPKLPIQIQGLFDSIGHREDTFYVVSFSAEHLLVPATIKNPLSRPKMSLIMPAPPVAFNGKSCTLKKELWLQLNFRFKGTVHSPPQHFTMMQIDCEVINTSIVHIKEDVIPTQFGIRFPKSRASEAFKKRNFSNLRETNPFGQFGKRSPYRHQSEGMKTFSSDLPTAKRIPVPPKFKHYLKQRTNNLWEMLLFKYISMN